VKDEDGNESATQLLRPPAHTGRLLAASMQRKQVLLVLGTQGGWQWCAQASRAPQTQHAPCARPYLAACVASHGLANPAIPGDLLKRRPRMQHTTTKHTLPTHTHTALHTPNTCMTHPTQRRPLVIHVTQILPETPHTFVAPGCMASAQLQPGLPGMNQTSHRPSNQHELPCSTGAPARVAQAFFQKAHCEECI